MSHNIRSIWTRVTTLSISQLAHGDESLLQTNSDLHMVMSHYFKQILTCRGSCNGMTCGNRNEANNSISIHFELQLPFSGDTRNQMEVFLKFAIWVILFIEWARLFLKYTVIAILKWHTSALELATTYKMTLGGLIHINNQSTQYNVKGIMEEVFFNIYNMKKWRFFKGLQIRINPHLKIPTYV